MSFLERIAAVARQRFNSDEFFVPVYNASVFHALMGEAIETATRDPGDGLVLVVDAQSACNGIALERVQTVAQKIVVIGEPAPDWADEPNVERVPFSEYLGPNDRLLIALSNRLNLAFVGDLSQGVAGGAGHFGGWSGQRSSVKTILQFLYEECLHQKTPAFCDVTSEEAEAAGGHSMHLTSVLAQQLVSLQKNIAKDKDDLFSVLEILKAISAERRAHDVLFVFVEQVARVVEMERCSVVRIWGGDSKGHVLASHEDENIVDFTIDLKKYPELRRCLRKREKVIINDVLNDPLLKPFASDLQRANIRSVIVIPIVLYDPHVGSLILRGSRSSKPFALREVSFCEIVAEAASNALERAHLFESIQRANERLEHLAVTDGLTNLYNHRYFRERLEEEFERAKRYRQPLSCIVFDIDNFKTINDSYGHLQGDSILREMAKRIARVTRKSDIVARYGGEEFTIVMPQTGAEGAMAQAQRVLTEVRERPYAGMPADAKVTVSIGVAVFDAESMLDCEALIRVADSALYEAKSNGKNQAVLGRVTT